MSKQKILIVDDDNNIAELISLYLTKNAMIPKSSMTGKKPCTHLNTITLT